MRTIENKHVLGLFHDRVKADDAISNLFEAGYTKDQVHVIAQQKVLDTVENRDDVDATEAGAQTGAVAGGIAGLLAGIGAITIPGVGPILSAGTILGTLASTAVGAGVGAAGGGLIGALIDLGINEEEAKSYEEGVRGGGILLIVMTDDAAEVQRILSEAGAAKIQHASHAA